MTIIMVQSSEVFSVRADTRNFSLTAACVFGPEVEPQCGNDNDTDNYRAGTVSVERDTSMAMVSMNESAIRALLRSV